MLLLVNLPLDLIKHLQSFLSHDDSHYFLNSNKLHFSSLKQEMIYFSLNEEKSREYVEDERFREMILSKVKDGRKQIGLSFNRLYEVPDLSKIVAYTMIFARRYPNFLKNVTSQHCFLPPMVKKIPFIPTVEELELYNCMNIKDFSNLSHLKKLEVQDATQLTDITPLQNIPHLTFVNCPNIQNFSLISSKRQTFLSLYHSAITDVSFLRNILTVQLCFCREIVNISPLHGIKNLFLYSCSSIQDISGLGNHHRLTISQCLSIERGYECFRTVRHVGILEAEVPDLSVFRQAKSLEITVFSSMESQLFHLKDIPELALVTSSTDREEVYDISHFRNISLTFSDDLIKISDHLPSQILHLELTDCDQILKIINEGKTSIFRHLQSLLIVSRLIEHVNGLGDIPTIILQNCSKLHDISGLGRNRCVELRSCRSLRDVSSLATVLIVTINDCKGITDYRCLSLVPRLKIV